MKEDLKFIFNNVNDWLKFAETKHAGLIVLNSGLIFGILSIYGSYAGQLHWFYILLAIKFIGISIFFSLISLYPMKIKEVAPKKLKDPNLFFNGDLAYMSVQTFKDEFMKTFSGHNFTALEDDLIKQTIFNSKVASRKYKLFTYAVICTTIGLAIPLLRVFCKVVLA